MQVDLLHLEVVQLGFRTAVSNIERLSFALNNLIEALGGRECDCSTCRETINQSLREARKVLASIREMPSLTGDAGIVNTPETKQDATKQ